MQHRTSLLSILAAATLALVPTACGGGGSGSSSAPGTLGSFASTGAVLAIDPTDAGLSSSPLAVGGYEAVHALARDSARDRLYAIAENDLLLRIDGGAQVTEIGRLDTPRSPHSLVFDPDTEQLIGIADYGKFDPSRLLRIDPETAEVVHYADTSRTAALALDRARNRLLAIGLTTSGVASNNLLSIDLDTGQSLLLFEHVSLHTVEALTFDPVTSLLYGVTHGAGLLAFDLGTQFIEDAFFFEHTFDELALDTDSGRFWALTTGDQAGELLLDGTQAGAWAPTVTLGRELTGMTYDPAGRRYLAVDVRNRELVEIDAATGRASTLAPIAPRQNGELRDVRTLAFDPALGRLFGVDGTAGRLVELDPVTAAVSEFDLVVDPSTALALDPDTGVLFGYDETETLYELLPDAEAKLVRASGVGVGDIVALAWEPASQRFVALHDRAGSAIEPVLSSFTIDGTGVTSEVSVPRDLSGFGYDSDAGRFHAFGLGHPYYEFEIDMVTPGARPVARSLDGAWRTFYRAALSVPSRGVVYATAGDLVLEYDLSENSMRLLGGAPDGMDATDLLWDPVAERLGLRERDVVRWVEPTYPWLPKKTDAAPASHDMRITCDPESGNLWGVESGMLLDVQIGSLPKATPVTSAPMPSFEADAIAYSPAHDAVFAVRAGSGSSDGKVVRFDGESGAWAEVGGLDEQLGVLFTY